MEKRLANPSRYSYVFLGISALVGLYICSMYDYLLFHGIAEIFAVAVASCIWMISWNSRRIIRNTFFLLVGIAYLFVAGLDLLHTLAYSGMGIFPGDEKNLATQLWIAARYFESISLLVAALLIDRKPKVTPLFLFYAIAFSLVLGTIFYWGIFPVCYIDGVGLTAFKKASEYVISLLLLAGLYALYRKRNRFDATVYHLLMASMIVTICSEMTFTLYIDVYGLLNFFGHFLKIVSFYLVYKAIIETGLATPYRLLFRDLTRSEEALRESVARFSTAIESLPFDFFIMDEDNRYLMQNSASKKRWGNIIGKRLEDINMPETLLAHWKSANRKALNGEIVRSETSLRIGDEDKCYHNIASPIYDGNRIRGILGVNIDITEQKRAEKALRESESRYRQLSQSLEQTVKDKVEELRLAETLASIGRMVSVVAHEVRNPLQTIQMGIEAVRKYLGSEPEQREIIEEIENGVDLLNGIVRDLLEYSKPLSLECSTESVETIVRQALQSLHHRLANIRVNVELDKDNCEISADPTKLVSVFINLISNAIEAMPNGGEISIHSQGEEDNGRRALRIVISDSGCGIKEEHLKKIFEPFFTTKTRGVGLGIPACKKIIEAHSGTLHITSKPREGTTVYVTLPAEPSGIKDPAPRQ